MAVLDAIMQLPPISWRGLTAHCDLAPLDGSHDQAERRLPYRDGAGHDHTGRAPYRIDARLYFIETIESGSFTGSSDTGGDKTLNMDSFVDWLPALEDGSSDELRHPIRGPMRARVLTWRINLDAKVRSGVIVDVTWVETIDDFDEPNPLATVDFNPSAQAKAADEAMAALSIPYPTGVHGSTSLTGLIDQIEGAIISGSLTVGGLINQGIGVANKLLNVVDAINDPMAWALQNHLLNFYSSLVNLKKRIAKTSSRATAQLTTQSETTFNALEVELPPNTVNDLMGLNLNLLRQPSIPKGSVVTYYTE